MQWEGQEKNFGVRVVFVMGDTGRDRGKGNSDNVWKGVLVGILSLVIIGGMIVATLSL